MNEASESSQNPSAFDAFSQNARSNTGFSRNSMSGKRLIEDGKEEQQLYGSIKGDDYIPITNKMLGDIETEVVR